MLQKLQFKPGINREVSNYTNEGGWYTADKIRFRAGFPEQIGGWNRVSANQFAGVARNLINWNALDGDDLTGVGTNIKYYIEEGGTFNDITPLRASTTNSTTFAATNGSSVVTVTESAHGAVTGDYVTFSNAVSLGGNVTAAILNAEHEVTTVLTNNTYTITVSVTANASDSGNGGSATDAAYQLNIGPDVFNFASGWSTGTWPDYATVSLSNPFNTTEYNSAITVNSTGQGLSTGDFVYFASIGTPFAISGDSRAAINCTEVMLKAFYITKVNNDSYTISLANIGDKTYTADANGTGVGGTVSLYTKATTTSTWGTTGVSNLAQQLRLWTSSTFGEDLVFNVYEGGIFYWDKSGGFTRAVTLASLTGSNAPTQVICSLVSDQSRHVIAFGCNNLGGSGAFDPLQVRWSDTEDAGDWVPTATNTSGDYRLDKGSKIIGVTQTRQEILIFTDGAVYSMQYVGFPYVFTFTLLAENVSLVSPNAVMTANNLVYWMGDGKFYVYDGQVRVLPSTLRSYVYDNRNAEQDFQIFAGGNQGFSEVWWFYCSGTSTTVDSYVIYNYLDNIWYFGSLARSAWLDSAIKNNPIAADYNKRLLNHEVGVDDASGSSSAAISSYIESSDFDIGDGERFGYVWRIIPDINFSGSSVSTPGVTMTLTPRNFSGASYTTETAKSVDATAISPTQLYTNQVNVRVRGRQMKFRIDGSSLLGTKWQLGTPRMDIRTDGKQ